VAALSYGGVVVWVGELAYPLGSLAEAGANIPVGIRETRFYLQCLGVHRRRMRLSFCWLKMVHYS
jgi:hypothetical protein